MIRQLGKLAARHDPRNLQLSRYLKLPAFPISASYQRKVSNWPMMLNDQIGDCAIAAPGHMIQQWSTYAGVPQVLPDSDILRAYEAITGYTPADPSTDRGAYMLDVLNYWRKHGIGGHKIAAYVSVNPLLPDEVSAAVYLFGNVYLGVQLPVSAQDAGFWAVPSYGPVGDGTPGSWGGHAIPMVQYAPGGTGVVTWGELFWMSWNFLRAYCDEAYAVLSEDWINARTAQAPMGFDFRQLKADLALVSA